MSLSKQLYFIIAFIFILIFTGNFIISVKNTKEYLEIEASTKAQDTATSLGMSLKGLMKNKKDAEIQSIINAIANRGFYKQIRLENQYFTITKEELITHANNIDSRKNWEISKVRIDKSIGKIEDNSDDLELSKQLEALEHDNDALFNDNKEYKLIPSAIFNASKEVKVDFTLTDENGNKVKTYALLKLNRVIAEVTRAEKFDYVPQWFINTLHIELPEKQSQISDGWQTTATIYVSANAGDAYAKLFEQVKSGLTYSLFAFLLSMAFLFVFVQLLLRPLKNIEKLAQSIAHGNFKTIKKLPWTTEVKNVALSMNEMSTKIESVITKLNKNLESLTQKLSKDELTGLNLKQSFETDMKKMFMSKSDGYLFCIKIENLADYAKTHTSEEVNKFIQEFAKILQGYEEQEKLDINAYRFYGSEFALLTDGLTYEEAKKLTIEIKKDFENLAKDIDKREVAHIGATPFNKIGTTDQMLSAANEAYEKAKLIGPNECFIRDDNDLVRDMKAWRELVFDIIDNRKFEVDFIGDALILNGENEGQTTMQEAFTKAFDLESNPIPIGTFVSIAEQYDKVIDFDKAVIRRVIEDIKEKEIKHSITINLSLDSVANISFIAWLQEQIEQNHEIASQLVFSLTAYAVTKDINQFKYFVDQVHEKGAKVIIKRFESKFIPLDNIKDLDLDYIRLAREYTRGISTDNSKQSFVEAMVEMTHLLNIKLFAENVTSDEDIKTVKTLKVHGASR